jgi:glycosyltransferase involved in cell wall biosynthesis
MWEALHAGLEWLDDVDLMLSPTRHTAALLAEWKERFRFPWRIELMPWPVNVERFPFRRRYYCSQFVYVHGSGGAPAITRDDTPTHFRRKGLATLLAAAREVPDIPILVYGFPSDMSGASASVAFRPHPLDNSLLYNEGDVCVQPSHWEGLGLPLLECQAAGMPLVTTDAPPMNEHRPLALIPAVERPAFLSEDLCITAAQIQPDDLARVMRRLYGRSMFFASGRARRFIVREHNWRTARVKLLSSIAKLVSAGRTDTLAPVY